jgi:type VI protein secretion system component VasK
MGTGRGTIMLDQFVADMQSQAAAEGKAAEAGEVEEREELESVATAAASSSAQPAVLARQDSAEQTQRLAYFCHLLRQQRYPLCPTNGVLTLLPYEVFQASPRETQEMQRAIRSDLSTMQQELQSRFPVTALVVGMQNERGFREIVRRVGRERSLGQRFGRRFDVRLIATADQMAALCIHVCGVFEDWIHTLFREAEALSRPGNTRLYSLLCKIRCNFAPVLKDVLSGGFGFDTQQKTFDEPIAFSGCYFAATGETEDQQAFVRGVFEKLGEEQEEVEWTRRAKKSNRRYQTFALVAAVVSALLLITIVATIVYRLAT